MRDKDFGGTFARYSIGIPTPEGFVKFKL